MVAQVDREHPGVIHCFSCAGIARADDDLDTGDGESGGSGVQHGGLGEGMHSPRYSGNRYRLAGTGEAVREDEDLDIVEPKGVPGTPDYRGPERETPTRKRGTDSEVVEEVRFELQKDARLVRARIDVACQDGRVVLSGMVERTEDIEHAIQLCRAVVDVDDVVSRLEVGEIPNDGSPCEPVRTT